ncbi:biogenesis of lysosome-related organelles complex 1 subunit 4-like isoform X3 [Scyliorhinus torazame]|uniref:biogenesis of lysosome-related organelles complex 1 subunit 4-like isoform X3 n=1 Tax=Scyliorhinus torazame TaxID=75743 RepID=UPI003B5CCC47
MEEEGSRASTEAVGSRGGPSGQGEENEEENGSGYHAGEDVTESRAEGEQEALLWRTANCYSGYLTAAAGGEIQQLEQSLEAMLTRVDEFCGMLDMAFVKMIGQNVGVLDDQVTQAEAELGNFPSAFRKILHSIGTPSFLNKSSFPKRQQQKFEPPALFRTEDYFTVQNSQPHE